MEEGEGCLVQEAEVEGAYVGGLGEGDARLHVEGEGRGEDEAGDAPDAEGRGEAVGVEEPLHGDGEDDTREAGAGLEGVFSVGW